MAMDPHHFNADPDSDFHFNADPDPAFHFIANPDPAPHHSDARSADPVGLHFEPLMLLNPDPAFYLNADPDPASNNNADPIYNPGK
jgi:hypothetical protein